MVTSLQNRLWDIECWRSAFTMPSDGAFSIFYRGCKQSNLSTYTALAGFSVAKVIVFYLFAVICRAFFSKAIFFNFFPHSALWVAWQLEYPFLSVVGCRVILCIHRAAALCFSRLWGVWHWAQSRPMAQAQNCVCASMGAER